jgi:hypothetical protein
VSETICATGVGRDDNGRHDAGAAITMMGGRLRNLIGFGNITRDVDGSLAGFDLPAEMVALTGPI